MALHVHRAPSTDLLADRLADVLAERVADPFVREVVVVPARGVERWLTQRLSHRLGVGPRGGDGVCAGVEFLHPSSLVALLTGTERTDPWHPDRLVWPVLAVLDEQIDEPWCRPVAVHLGAFHTGVEQELRRNRRYSVARRVAQLYSDYAVQRPQVLSDWQGGNDTDGAGVVLAPDLEWQAELWRQVVARVDAVPPDRRHAETVAALREGRVSPDLPDRLSMFGHTRLATTEIDLLDALAAHREVRLWLPDPSPAAGQRLAEALAGGPVRRRDDTSAELVQHPLLASLGRDSRELVRSLTRVESATEVLPSSEARTDTLLGWLQQDLRHDAASGNPARVLAEHDRSIQVHACHGPARQVEVLREVLVGLLQDDPTLEPRDILVMCPDVEAYAPLIQAGFGLGAEAGVPAVASHPAHRLRVRLADRGLGATNPLLGVAQQLITLSMGRATASELLDLVAAEPVRRRFGFTDNDIEQIANWVQDSGIRWGIDARHRTAFDLDGVAQNTWRRGLDRVLLGVAMADEPECLPVGDTVALDAVGSGAIDLAGRFAELLDRVEAGVDALTASGPAPDWMGALRESVAALTAVPMRGAWMTAQFERELATIAASGSGADEVQIRLADVRWLLERRLEGRPTRSNFRTGTLTVCTMTPMRSVPHRVVCLLGLDDGVFPRGRDVDGDNVLARDPITGEQDRRSEDRQLLLDALMSATQTVVITYSGASEHNGQPRPPAVPVGELLDALDRTTGAPVRDRILVKHPLQPFGEPNFVAGALGGQSPFSFDQISLSGARARRHQHPAPPLATGPLKVDQPTEITLTDLKDFLRNAAKFHLKAHDVGVLWEDNPVRDAIPIDLDALEKWAIGDRMLAAAAAGADPLALIRDELLRGGLPPGVLGETALHGVVDVVQRLVTKAAQDPAVPARSVEVLVEFDSGVVLTGTVPRVHDDVVVVTSYSSQGPKVIAPGWVDVLAVAAATGQPARGLLVARFGKGIRPVELGPVDPEFARAHLETLTSTLRQGAVEALPLPVVTSMTWARNAGRPNQVLAARDKWLGERGSSIPGEAQDAAWALLYPDASVRDLTKAGLDQWAMRVWGPLLPMTGGRW